jgi:hypothetical protein
MSIKTDDNENLSLADLSRSMANKQVDNEETSSDKSLNDSEKLPHLSL